MASVKIEIIFCENTFSKVLNIDNFNKIGNNDRFISYFVIISSAEQACSRFQLKLGEQSVPLKVPPLFQVET